MEYQKNLNKDETSQRRSKILEKIEFEGTVRVKELSELHHVSKVTIRNDLDQLEKKNLLVRARGGAMKLQRVGIDYNLNVKSMKHSLEKQAIGKKAAELVKDGETIILDSGTTTLEVAKNLDKFNNLTVITNSLHIAGQMVDTPNVRVIVPGGSLRRNSLSLVGSSAEEILKNYYCDKVFIGVDGIDSNYGISTPNFEEAHLNNVMIDNSREVIVVTDSSKFKHRSFASIAPLSKIHTIVTDKNIPADEKQAIENLGIKLIIVG
ncbi:MAG: DeoR/GlpR transcriptional regulator [Ignavibacteriae bacterium]|nr:DeoR/GlpR transcriptional regulator [Ignavibacteriota bacterium]MCB9075920.1 DeoR/GlpR transcriptional regulator [Chitinophagales bacterium]MCB9247733.1 DeoR/GlpR transcriptional regulator [Ignavibacteriales bacterium]MCB0745850.1 DeoR/GlpR transcriptional regulator [Ignavibacteriota bacterium]MCB0750145.1 DeoR/GlpR transcriptional regulator [Ignavibacteriota bacterium]